MRSPLFSTPASTATPRRPRRRPPTASRPHRRSQRSRTQRDRYRLVLNLCHPWPPEPGTGRSPLPLRLSHLQQPFPATSPRARVARAACARDPGIVVAPLPTRHSTLARVRQTSRSAANDPAPARDARAPFRSSHHTSALIVKAPRVDPQSALAVPARTPTCPQHHARQTTDPRALPAPTRVLRDTHENPHRIR